MRANRFGKDTIVARIHTHGAYDPEYDNDDFSKEDKKISRKKGVTSYWVTPLGTLKKYDPFTRNNLLLYSDFPFDKKHPRRKAGK